MKKLISMLFVLLCFTTAVSAAATPDKNIPIDISVNGSFIKTDAPAFIDYDTTFVPIRFVSDALGAHSVTWDQSRATATIKQGSTTIQITENKKEAYVNGRKVILNKSARIHSGRLYVPVRFVAESFGAKVGWDNTYYIVQINKSGVSVNSSLIDWRYTKDEIFWLGRIIEAESSGEPASGKVAVGNVILNRVKSNEFPNTIYTVIFDRTHGVQFEPIMNGSIYNTPSAESMISAKRALRGENIAGNSLYFLNPRTAANSWIANNRPYYMTIHNHDFYL